MLWNMEDGMRIKPSRILLFGFFLAAAGTGAQTNTIISVSPKGIVPMGDSSSLFTLGGGAEASGSFLPDAFPLYLKGLASYVLLPAQADSSYLSLISVGAGTGFAPNLGTFASFRLGAAGGVYLASYGNEVGANPFIKAEASASFNFSPSFSLGLGAGYDYYLTNNGNGIVPLLSAVSGTLSFSLHPGASSAGADKSRLRILDPDFNRIFPVFYSYYNDNPLGNVNLRNEEKGGIEKLQLRFYVPQFMEAPKSSMVIDRLEQGKSVEIPLFALFKDSLLEITEATVVTAEIQASYMYKGKEVSVSAPFSLQIQNRNEMTWDDDRKAASFVTARDPAVLKFSRNISAAVRSAGSTAVNEKLRTGMAILTALKLYGMEYIVDPKSSYIELSSAADTVDYLQFPSQTLDYQAGDCDDLSILYAALLESISTRAAFITVPGHIYVAFALDMDQNEAEQTFAGTRDFIFNEGDTWVPVEVTALQEGFLKAWSLGAKQWREASAAGTAAILPVQDAWRVYGPTGFSSNAAAPLVPTSAEVLPPYLADLKTFIDREIAPQVADLQTRIAAAKGSARLVNRLGTLYARYGLYDEAEAQFLLALKQDSGYLPALINLGNIYFIKPDLKNALDYFSKAFKYRSDDPTVLLGLARTHFDREEYAQAVKRYREAENIDPKKVQSYAYIISENQNTARASASQDRNKVDWNE